MYYTHQTFIALIIIHTLGTCMHSLNLVTVLNEDSRIAMNAVFVLVGHTSLMYYTCTLKRGNTRCCSMPHCPIPPSTLPSDSASEKVQRRPSLIREGGQPVVEDIEEAQLVSRPSSRLGNEPASNHVDGGELSREELIRSYCWSTSTQRYNYECLLSLVYPIFPSHHYQ